LLASNGYLILLRSMKRYRVVNQGFDTRARILSIEIQNWWERM
jgi:hypothetical protein